MPACRKFPVCHNGFPLKTFLLLPLCETSPLAQSHLCLPETTHPHVWQVKGSSANFLWLLLSFLSLFPFFLPHSSSCSYHFEVIPTLSLFSFVLSGLLHYLVLVDSLPALFKLVSGLGRVRVPPPPYLLIIVSRPRANASPLCKGCVISSSNNGYFCVQSPSTWNLRAGCIPH